MKSRLKTRSILKWAATFASCALLSIWIGSAWRAVTWGDRFWDRVLLEHGRVTVVNDPCRASLSKQVSADFANTLMGYKQREAQLLASGRSETDKEVQLARRLGAYAAGQADISAEYGFGVRSRRVPPGFSIWFDWGVPRGGRFFGGTTSTPPLWMVKIPLWIFALPVVALSVLPWRLELRDRHRARTGCCVRCGYDRRGLEAEVVCPECGGSTSVMS